MNYTKELGETARVVLAEAPGEPFDAEFVSALLDEIDRLTTELKQKYVDIENGLFFGKPVMYWAELDAHQKVIGHDTLLAELVTWKRQCNELTAELEKHRWIAVGERLPEKESGDTGEEYIVYSGFFDRSHSAWWRDGEWYSDYQGTHRFKKQNITHWKYLPEPPKEDA